MTQEEQHLLDAMIQRIREVCGENKSEAWCMNFINQAVTEQLSWMSQEEN